MFGIIPHEIEKVESVQLDAYLEVILMEISLEIYRSTGEK